MKPFEEWVREPIKTKVKVYYIPNNVWSDNGGQDYYTECCVCGKTDVVDLEWFSEADYGTEYRHHCGGSPRCCP